MSKIRLPEIEFFALTHKFTDEPIRLDQCTVVINQKRFVETHLSFLKANSRKEIITPYWDRLVKFYLIIRNEKKH